MYKDLREMGYTIVFKPTVLHGEVVKGNVDVELVLAVMADWDKYKQAVIISGDGDFYSLVKYLLEKNKLAGLLVPNGRKYSSLFKEIPTDKIEFMDQLRSQFSYRPGAHNSKAVETGNGAQS